VSFWSRGEKDEEGHMLWNFNWKLEEGTEFLKAAKRKEAESQRRL